MTKLEDKPLSLMLIALQRAEFCSGMATLMVPERQDQFYMVGILSSLDIFFDISMKTLVNKLPINEESKVALLSYSGVIGLALKAAIAYEKFQLDTIDKTGLRKFGITQQDLHTVFLDSNLKAQDYIGSL
jgi:EAL and modified HD-GYP domain-containing signal transduction protein